MSVELKGRLPSIGQLKVVMDSTNTVKAFVIYSGQRKKISIPDNKIFIRLENTASKADTVVCEKILEQPINNFSPSLKKYFLSKSLVGRKIIAHNSSESFKLVIKININAVDNEGLTFLHRAAKAGQEEVVDFLLSQPGVDIQARTKLGDTALHLAVQGESQAVINALLPYFNINERNNQKLTPLHIASLRGSSELIRYLLDQPRIDLKAKTIFGMTALHLSAISGNAESMRALLDSKQFQLNEIDDGGSTALHHAAMFNQIGISRFLLRQPGIDVNAQNSIGMTALHQAVDGVKPLLLDDFLNVLESKGVFNEKIRLRIIRLFLSHNAIDLTRQTEKGATALHLAAANGYNKVMEELITKGLDINAEDKAGRTPLHYAIGSNQLEMVLYLLRQANIDVAHTTKNGATALHLAALWGCIEVADALIKNGFDINKGDRNGMTPLHYAIGSNQLKMVLRFLKDKNTDVARKTKNGATALHLAASKGNKKIIMLLLRTKKFDVFDQDNEGLTPVLYAYMHASPPESGIAEFLLEKSGYTFDQVVAAFEKLKVDSTASEVAEEKKCSGTHKKRLFIGEGNFSGVLEVIKKHDRAAGHSLGQSLGHSIIATEYKEKKLCPPGTLENVKELERRGATVRFGINGTKLHECFKGQNFPRIHWNGPHDGSFPKEQSLPKLLEDFMQSCGQIQKKGGRVHLSLAQPEPEEGGWSKKEYYQGYYYNIVQAVSYAGYRLFEKRAFDKQRYPNYIHFQTMKDESASVMEKGAREFVFEKVGKKLFYKAAMTALGNVGEYAKILKRGGAKNYAVRKRYLVEEHRNFFQCLTDEGSSDYEE